MPSSRATGSRPATRGFRATRAGIAGASAPSTASSSCRTPMPTGAGAAPSRSTASASNQGNCGETRRSRGSACTSISGRATSTPWGTDMGSHHSEPEPWVVHRVRALESLLIEKGLLSTEVVDAVVQTYEKDVGPMNGARVVARAWVDPGYKQRLLENGTAAIAELGIGGRGGGDKMVVVENTPAVRYMVLPLRPEGTERLSETELAALVTRDAMIGVARVQAPAAAR